MVDNRLVSKSKRINKLICRFKLVEDYRAIVRLELVDCAVVFEKD